MTHSLKAPKPLVKGKDFVVIKREEYDAFLVYVKWQQELYDDDIAVGLKEIEQGKAIGPFGTVQELRQSLES